MKILPMLTATITEKKPSIKSVMDTARDFILAGGLPKRILADNEKTGFTILDNNPLITCYSGCPIRSKCYDVKLLKLRPSVMKARCERHYLMQYRPDDYVAQLVAEIHAIKVTPSRIRLYGGGDYQIHHTPIIQQIAKVFPNVVFYAISKTIKFHPDEARKLLALPNFHLNMSEAVGFRFEGPIWASIAKHPRVSKVFTFMPEDSVSEAMGADIVFNVSKNKDDINTYTDASLNLCPCDSHEIDREKACASCNRCSVKGGARSFMEGITGF